MRLPYRFGKYTLVEKIAAGGTAEIYKALKGSGRKARTVAVKRILPSWGKNGEIEAMLMDEGRVLSHLRHPAIVQVYEQGSFEGMPFLAMEYVDGIDCGRLLLNLIRDASPLEPRLALYIVEQILLALEFAHRSVNSAGRPLGIVHRDISPQNVLLSWEGGVKVTDFGIAKGLHRTHETELGQLKGKYAYMAPEQAMGERIDQRADLFACGIVLWELLTSRRLFEGSSDMEVLQKVRSAKPSMSGIDGFSPEICSTVMLALAPDPARRYASASEMLCDVRRSALSAGGMATSYDLAEFLGKLFSSECEKFFSPVIFSRTAAGPATIPIGFSPREKHAGKRTLALRVAGVAAMLTVIAAAPPSKGSLPVVRAGSEPVRLVKEKPIAQELLKLPKLSGAIAIDSDPPHADGVLTLGKMKKEIRAPFSLKEIEIGEAVEGEVELFAPGFKRKLVRFRLDPSQPAFVKRIVLEKVLFATLSVHARPWGLVDIPGVTAGRETPVLGLKLGAGEYAIRVTHPPSGMVASGSVKLTGGAAKRCVAKFGESSVLSCR